MKKLICDVCNEEIDAYDNYDVDGYSKFVTVQTLDSREFGNEEYNICNDCFRKILNFAVSVRHSMTHIINKSTIEEVIDNPRYEKGE